MDTHAHQHPTVGAGHPELPDLRWALDAAPSGPARAKQAFDLGVDALVAGLRVRLSGRCAD